MKINSFSLFANVPTWIQSLYPSRIWRKKTNKKELFLTFDDGPTPQVTSWVLDFLAQEKVPAIFFVIGKNAQAHPELLARIKQEGHQIGNHTYNHQKGWQTPLKEYIESVKKTEEYCTQKWFRPPYGKASLAQIKNINQLGYKTIMWTNLSFDFQPDINTHQVLENLKKTIKPGNIIVFHDSVKASSNLNIILPAFIRWAKKQGFIFTNQL
jgi:peptidoglycan/xylan/chitin deacetylase (PgdA/CDA1 family)